MLGAADPELARSAHSWLAEVHAMDINGARRWSHEPTAGWPRLELAGLGWPESTHRWTGTPGRDPRRAVGTNGTLIPITGVIGDNGIFRW